MTTSERQSTCVPCTSLNQSHLLDRAQIEQALVDHDLALLWKVTTANDTPALSRQFVAKNFTAALDAIQAIGVVAERENHHPDIHLTNYRNVELIVYTHKLGGLTEADVQLARLVDQEVAIEYSPKWLKEHPQAAGTSKSS